jgi:hypothetical protein
LCAIGWTLCQCSGRKPLVADPCVDPGVAVDPRGWGGCLCSQGHATRGRRVGPTPSRPRGDWRAYRWGSGRMHSRATREAIPRLDRSCGPHSISGRRPARAGALFGDLSAGSLHCREKRRRAVSVRWWPAWLPRFGSQRGASGLAKGVPSWTRRGNTSNPCVAPAGFWIRERRRRATERASRFLIRPHPPATQASGATASVRASS